MRDSGHLVVETSLCAVVAIVKPNKIISPTEVIDTQIY